jgi:hypothetical protein
MVQIINRLSRSRSSNVRTRTVILVPMNNPTKLLVARIVPFTFVGMESMTLARPVILESVFKDVV